MSDAVHVRRRCQFCRCCGQMMFEFFSALDGHYGLATAPEGARRKGPSDTREVRCSTCGARYRLLDRLDSFGQPVVRIST